MPLNTTAENFKKIVDGLGPHIQGVSDFDDLTNRPLESDAIDIDDLDLPMPAKPTDYPILFDETGTEYKVGYYKRASDGKVKPVYRKTVDCGALPNASIKITNHNISNIDYIINITGIAIDSTTKESRPIPSVNTKQIGYCFSVDADDTAISINTGSTDRSNFDGYITLQYTKTTDEWKDLP